MLDGGVGLGSGSATGQELGGSPPPADSQRPRAIGELEWKDRAVEAERELADAQQELKAALEELQTLRDAVAGLEMSREIDQQLVRARAIDLETARLLVQREMERMESPDIARAVGELRRSKPFLFGQGSGSAFIGALGSGASAGVSASALNQIDEAAEEARRSGDRRALLRYLRMRRSV